MTATRGAAGTTPDRSRAEPGRLRTIARLTALELRLMGREPSVLVGLLAFPAVTVLIIAGVFGSTPDPEFGGVRPTEHYVVGYLGVVLASLGLVTIPAHLAAQRERGVFRRYRAAGIDAATLVGSHVALGAVVGVVAGAVVLLVGGSMYGLPPMDDPSAVVGCFAAGLVCFVAIGTALGAVLPSSRAAAAVGNLLFVPAFLLGGGGPPRDVMSDAMARISDLLPLSHVVGGLRQSWLGTTDDPTALWWPALIALVSVIVAARSLRRQIA